MYFEIGAHFRNAHGVLKLAQIDREFAKVLIGKQAGNKNFIDTVVGPGDY